VQIFGDMLTLLLDMAVALSLLVYPYYLHRKMVWYLASQGTERKPIDLFFCAHVTAILAFIAFAVLLFILARVFGIMGMVVLVAAAIGGLVFWKIAIFENVAERRKRSVALAAIAKSAHQIWLQDILVAVFFFGITMTIAQAIPSVDKTGLIPFAIAELLTHAVALLIGMDICRYVQFKSDHAGRVIFFVFCMFMAAVPFAIFLEIVAWMAWRSGLANAAFEAARREEIQRKAAAVEKKNGES